MKLKPLDSNMNQAHLGKWVVLFSYETPVAAMDEKTGKYYQTDQKFSSTTSRHLSKWLGKNKDEAEKKPQSFFNGLVKESVNNYSANVVSESMDRLFNNNYTIGNIGMINEDDNNDDDDDEIEGGWFVLDEEGDIYDGGVGNKGYSSFEQAENKKLEAEQRHFKNLGEDDSFILTVAYGHMENGHFEKLSFKNDNMNESSNEEEKFWYVSTDGTIEFQMTLAQAESVSQPGKDAEEDVRQLMRDPDMKEIVDYLYDNMDNVKEELKGYGAWDDEELEDEDMNIVRMIWLAGNDISENHFVNSHDDSEIEENVNEEDIMNESHGNLLDQQVMDSRNIIKRIKELENEDELEEYEKEELEFLKEFEDEGIPEWDDGATLINSDYWIEYVKRMLKDTGDIPRDLPDYIVIDWDKTADNISQYYSTITVNGNDWYYRNV